MRYKDKLILGGILILVVLIVFVVYRNKLKSIDSFFVECNYDTMLPVEGTYQYSYKYRLYNNLANPGLFTTIAGDAVPQAAFAIYRTDINKMFIDPRVNGGFFFYDNYLYITKSQGPVDRIDALGRVWQLADGFQTIMNKPIIKDIMDAGNLYLDIVKDNTSKYLINIKNITIDQKPNEIKGRINRLFSDGSRDTIDANFTNTSYYAFKLDSSNPVISSTNLIPNESYDIYLKDKSKCPQPCVYKINKDGLTLCKESGDGSTCSNTESVQVEYIKDPSSPPNCVGSPPPSVQFKCKENIKKCGVDENVAKCERAKNKYKRDNNVTGDAWEHYLKIGAYEEKSWPSEECDCKIGEWGPFTPAECPSCGPDGTKRTRTRTRTFTPAQEGGTCPETNPSTTEEETCDIQSCSDQCIVEWSPPTSACEPDTGTCGAGKGKRTQTGTHKSLVPGACESLPASSKPSTTRTVPCDLPACATCSSTDWQTGPCVGENGRTCGSGTRTKTRTVRTPNASGTGCDERVETETESCSLGACRDCSVGAWQTDNRCVATGGGNCGPGRITYTRTVTEGQEGGRLCSPEELQRTRTVDCDLGSCNADCQYTWSEWSSCSTTCDTATQKGVQTRRPVGPNGQGAPIQAKGNGAKCPDAQERPCQPANKVCPIDCSVKKDWYDAPGERCMPDPAKGKNCGPGNGRIKQIRDLNPANETGTCNLEVERFRTCDLPECPVDCVIGPWTPDVTQCPTVTGKKCGQDIMLEQKRTITPAKFGGQCVDPDSKMAITLETTEQKKTINCGLPECGIKCIPSPWSPWGACEGKCDEGVQKRTRSIQKIVADVPNVSCSPEELKAEERQACALKPCVGPTQLYEIRRGKAFDLNHFDMTDKAARYKSFSTRLR